MNKIFIIFLLITTTGYSQQYVKIKNSSLDKITVKDYRIPTASAFKINFSIDAVFKNENYGNLLPTQVYKKSATIFDATKILLLPKNKFFCYTYGCTRSGTSTGYYTLKNDTLSLIGSKSVFFSLKNDKFVKSKNYGFVDLGTAIYVIKKNELVFIK